MLYNILHSDFLVMKQINRNVLDNDNKLLRNMLYNNKSNYAIGI